MMKIGSNERSEWS